MLHTYIHRYRSMYIYIYLHAYSASTVRRGPINPLLMKDVRSWQRLFAKRDYIFCRILRQSMKICRDETRSNNAQPPRDHGPLFMAARVSTSHSFNIWKVPKAPQFSSVFSGF